MTDQTQAGGTQTLMRDMGLTDSAIERRKRIVGLEPADLVRIAAVREVVTQHTEDCVATFFNHLSGLDEARPLMASRKLVEKARALKAEHLAAMVQGNYGSRYVEQRLELGVLYARAGLDTRTFLGAFHQLLRHIGNAIMKQFAQDPAEGFENFMALKKVAFFDIGIIVDILVFERERIIRQQQEAIRELSTPVLQIRERLLLLPIIGVIDTQRARLITESLLQAIRANRAKVVVMDVTGVATIDSKVANHLLQTVAAARLMGALVIVTGLTADVAQSLVTLGIELSSLNTVGDLQGGLEEAERILGYRMLSTDAVVAASLGRA
ncbi:MAG TPA: protoglobin domain-containing protein [Ideonella sp.]|uniref:protoglobin domain-containing protein n=1 Tax=Ideonella sp. TaxID=1929293 RepID=UPI002C8C18DC|nr:protoglobin domain-containing protein [Ideonella sp.]HSI51734.1 protoglobin domain-containing protein [Ideonella sp.]